MKLFCPTCGKPVPAEDVDLARTTARCSACGCEFDFANRSVERAFREPANGAALLPRPAHMHLERIGSEWTLRWRWFSLQHIPLIFFCVAWDGFLIFWYKMAFSGHAPWIMAVFPIAHVAVGVGLTYTLLTGLLNRTVVRVGPGYLSIHHWPLPWWGNRQVAAGDISQLFCETLAGNRGSRRHYLSAVMRDGTRLRLLSLENNSDVRFLEQWIEQCLGIPDRPVVGADSMV